MCSEFSYLTSLLRFKSTSCVLKYLVKSTDCVLSNTTASDLADKLGIRIQGEISLPEIGGYTSPDIFVNKNSNWKKITIYQSQTSISAFFPWTTIAYFHFRKNQKLKFVLEMSINCRRAQKCSQISIENIDILGISSKYKYFTI